MYKRQGNGQEELMQILTGEKKDRNVSIKYMDNDVEMLNPRERREIGLAFAPEERLGHAAVGNLNLLENSLITDPKKRFQKKMGFIDFGGLNAYTNEIIERNLT